MLLLLTYLSCLGEKIRVNIGSKLIHPTEGQLCAVGIIDTALQVPGFMEAEQAVPVGSDIVMDVKSTGSRESGWEKVVQNGGEGT